MRIIIGGERVLEAVEPNADESLHWARDYGLRCRRRQWGSSSVCKLVVSYDHLANGNDGLDGPKPPGPHGSVDAVFTMRVAVTAV
jgi:hypothetical protein